MSSVEKALVAGLAIGFGWLLGNVLLVDATAGPALGLGTVTLSGAIVAAVVGFVVTLLFR